MPYSLPLWIRWTMNTAKGKPFANYQKQESSLTNILGNHFRTQYTGAIYYPLKKEGLRFYQTRSNTVVLYDTMTAAFIEKAICMKTKEHLNNMENARPRVVLRANSQCGLQDLPRQEVRSSRKTQSDVQSFRETGCNIVDYRVSRNIPLNSSTTGWTKTTYCC